MILEWLFSAIDTLVRGFLALIPPINVPLPDLTPLFGILRGLNVFLPVNEALALATFSIALSTGLLIFRVTRMLLSHVPFIGGSG